MAEDETLQLIIRVLTLGGQEIDHRYVLCDSNESEKVIDNVVDMITAAMTPKISTPVWFEYPFIVYNPDNIFGIRTECLGSMEQGKAVRDEIKMKLIKTR